MHAGRFDLIVQRSCACILALRRAKHVQVRLLMFQVRRRYLACALQRCGAIRADYVYLRWLGFRAFGESYDIRTQGKGAFRFQELISDYIYGKPSVQRYSLGFFGARRGLIGMMRSLLRFPNTLMLFGCISCKVNPISSLKRMPV